MPPYYILPGRFWQELLESPFYGTPCYVYLNHKQKRRAGRLREGGTIMKENEVITTSSNMQNVTELLYLAALLLGGLLGACL